MKKLLILLLAISNFGYSQINSEGLIYYSSCDDTINNNTDYINIQQTHNRFRVNNQAIGFSNNQDSLIVHLNYNELIKDSAFTIAFWIRDNQESYESSPLKFGDYELKISYNGAGWFGHSDSIPSFIYPGSEFSNFEISYEYWVHVLITYKNGKWILRRTVYHEDVDWNETIFDSITNQWGPTYSYTLEETEITDTVTSTITQPFSELIFGSKLEGVIDELYVYNRVLNSNEQNQVISKDSLVLNTIKRDNKSTHIYQNNDNIIKINLDDSDIESIAIIDLTGKEIVSPRNFPIDLNYLPSNMYVLLVQLKNGSLVKEKVYIW